MLKRNEDTKERESYYYDIRPGLASAYCPTYYFAIQKVSNCFRIYNLYNNHGYVCPVLFSIVTTHTYERFVLLDKGIYESCLKSMMNYTSTEKEFCKVFQG